MITLGMSAVEKAIILSFGVITVNMNGGKMTKNEIIRMAREAGAFPELSETPEKDIVFLRRFAALVADRDTALLRQVQRVMGLMGADLICGAAHHEKADRHDIGDPCPIQKRWHEVFATLRERLGESK
jgi:hypothetical protein